MAVRVLEGAEDECGDVVRPVLELDPVLGGHPEHACNHDRGQGIGDLVDQVDPTFLACLAPCFLQQAVGDLPDLREIGRASCRERVCQYVWIPGGAVSLKK